MSLTREHILAQTDLKREEVQVPEWGGSVFVRVLTGSERDAMEARYAKEGKKNLRAQVAALTICDETGKNLFSLADVETLGKRSAAALDRVADVAYRLSKFTKEDTSALEAEADKGEAAEADAT